MIMSMLTHSPKILQSHFFPPTSASTIKWVFARSRQGLSHSPLKKRAVGGVDDDEYRTG